jgi:hypothetical protein
MNLRHFLRNLFGAGSLAALPPMPPGFKPVRSPKHQEFLDSLGRPKSVSIESAVHPKAVRPVLASVINGLYVSIHVEAGNVTLSWVNGTQPFQVLYRATDSDPWAPATEPMMARHVTIPIFDGPTGFFKIWEQVPLLTAVRDATGTHLSWDVPLLE